MILFRWAWRGLRAVLLFCAGAVLLVEEWGWRPLSRWLARWETWPPLARVEARIRTLSPYAALAFFLVPVLTLFPVKLLALWLIHQGSAVLGVTVIVLAKVVGTALAGRLFVLTEAQLRHFTWFDRGLNWWQATKAQLRLSLEKSSAWISVQRLRKKIAVRLGRWLRPQARRP